MTITGKASLTGLVLAALAGLALGLLALAGGMAASPSAAYADGHITNKDVCEAEGGVWTNDRGTKTCSQSFEIQDEDPPFFKAKGQKTESQKGNIGAQGTADTYDEDTNVEECTNSQDNEVPLTNPNCPTP